MYIYDSEIFLAVMQRRKYTSAVSEQSMECIRVSRPTCTFVTRPHPQYFSLVFRPHPQGCGLGVRLLNVHERVITVGIGWVLLVGLVAIVAIHNVQVCPRFVSMAHGV